MKEDRWFGSPHALQSWIRIAESLPARRNGGGDGLAAAEMER